MRRPLLFSRVNQYANRHIGGGPLQFQPGKLHYLVVDKDALAKIEEVYA